MRRLRPRSVTLLAALIAGIFTDTIIMVPSLHFAYRSVPVHAMLEVTATLIAFLTTILVWGRLKWRQGLDDLLLFVALGLLSVASLLFAVVPAAIWRDPHPFSTWTTIAASGASAALLAAAALVRPARLKNYEYSGRVAVVAMSLGLIAIGAVCGAFVDRLPIGIDPARPPGMSGALMGNNVIAFAQVVIAVLFLAAAIGFTHRAEKSGDEFFLWLGAAATFAAFARANYFIFPSLYSEWVYTGDVLRLAWHVLLFIGAVREIQLYQRAYVRSRVLEERRRIARDLHDGLAQELAFISTTSRDLAGRDGGSDSLKHLASAAERGLDESRRAIAALTRGDDEPFDIALVQAVEEVGARTGTHVFVRAEPAPEIIPDRQEQLLRIVREAVTNAARHGNPSVVRVAFSNGGVLRLSVEDDGIGFDPTNAEGNGFGLLSMRERAAAIGGEFTIESRPNGGTRIEVVIP